MKNSNSHLTPVTGGFSDNKKAAQNIRLDLKHHFPGIKFSVRSSLFDVKVAWTDGPTKEAVKSTLTKFTEYKSKLCFSEKYGLATRIFEDRSYSQSFIESALAAIAEKHNCEGIELTADAYEGGQLCNVYPKGLENLHTVSDLALKYMHTADYQSQK
ncbi:LPD29 domain-containing protein [Vibrio alginolyticus]|uniref:LPD29 domain-containing protein n=1 Tax=Vibrio TaxID=662 RepID=UPI0006CA85E4|nr:LPD29 domain-containing protein [Vibrio alginolyticus]KPM98453.1 hypothetical protein AOG25_08390 [Vibrio alginolyticus]CAH7140041.1 LPD29 domain-containing protein [Vibrio chagasii]